MGQHRKLLSALVLFGLAATVSCTSHGDDGSESGDDSTTEDSNAATRGSGTTSNGSGGASGTGTGSQGSDGNKTSSAGMSASTTGAPADSGSGGSGGSAGAGGDLPYSNVVAVSASGDEDNYTFSVSIESADIDCTQYTDWWEVLSEDGELLYRRILTHSHTDDNGTTDPDAPGNTFTRSGGPVAVTSDRVVIVRAHMSDFDGYNGQVMRGNVASGFDEAPDIGADFAADVEEAAPQPDGCSF